jgi:hypothetical protein
MNQPERSKQSNAANKTAKESGQKKPADLQFEENNSQDIQDTEKISTESLAVIEEIAELLSKEDIIAAIQKFKADSEEKKIAVEFANAHIQLLNQIVESDYKKGIVRTDVEIRDMISNVNSMLKKKDEYLFTTIVMHSPSHYRNIQKRFYAKIKKEEKEEKNDKKE